MNTHYKVHGKALELCNAFGYLWPGELFFLQALARSLPEGSVVVNIGAGAGTSSLGIVEVQPSLKVFTIDISEGGPLGGLENEVNAFRDTGLPLPTQILGDSHTCWKAWKDKIDLLLIDGDHSEDGLKADMDGWLHFIKPGGYAVFHDYNSTSWNGITHVIDERMSPDVWARVLKVDTLIAFRFIPPSIVPLKKEPTEAVYEPIEEPKVQYPAIKRKGKK